MSNLTLKLKTLKQHLCAFIVVSCSLIDFDVYFKAMIHLLCLVDLTHCFISGFGRFHFLPFLLAAVN